MVAVRRDLDQSREEVFATITDPETYPRWLVGARDIRATDANWPAPGSRFHHRVGLIGPLKVADSTEVLDVEPPRRLSLEVRARPFGRGRATFTIIDDPASRRRSCIELDEVPLGHLRRLGPILGPLTAARNKKSLAQLADYLEHGRSHRFPG